MNANVISKECSGCDAVGRKNSVRLSNTIAQAERVKFLFLLNSYHVLDPNLGFLYLKNDQQVHVVS